MRKILLSIGIVIFSLFFCLSLIAWETGWLENKVVDNLTIWGYVSALKGVCVVEDVSIGDDLYVKDNAYIGNLTISGNTELANVGVDGLCSRGDISLFGDIYLGGQDIIYGDTKLTFGANGLCLIGAFSNTGNLYSGGGEMRLGSLSGFRDNAGGDLEFTEDGGVSWADVGVGGAGTLAATLALGADAADISMTSLAKLEGVDAQVYVDLGNDGFLDLEADTQIRITAQTDFGDENITSIDRLEGLAAGEYIDLGTADYVDIAAAEAVRIWNGANEIFTVGALGACLIGSMSITGDMYGQGQIIDLPVQSAKLSANFICNSAAIDAGEGFWRLLFDDTRDEKAGWQFRMPYHYQDGLTAKIGYTTADANGANVVGMEVAIMAVSDGDLVDIVTESFDTWNDVGGGTTVPTTAGYLDEISITLTNNDSVAPGDLVYVLLLRDVDDDDDVSGDIEVVYFQLEYNR